MIIPVNYYNKNKRDDLPLGLISEFLCTLGEINMINITKRNSLGLAVSMATFVESTVNDMCAGLLNFSNGGVDAMALDNYWHHRCNWYGPSGIGTGRGLSGVHNWHQIPFLNALPDRGGIPETSNMFSDGDYVEFTAWPGMRMTISGDGWLGIAPAGQKITMRSLDFWRCEKWLIRENWVLIDLLDVYNQLGIDVLGRMREFNKAKRLP